MANTTNFGWETPDDTDLVKDGAAAMRTLGNAIDASLVDLKGGTTNQILAKNSNTDMDFKWVANDVGDITAVTAGTGLSGGGTSGDVTLTNTVATTFDAKGDLVVGTGADTFAKLVAGSNGDTLVADSSTSTGLRWQGSAIGKNATINGGCEIAQRGTSAVTLTAASFLYPVDRFFVARSSGTTGATAQQISSTGLDGFQYAVRIQRTAGNTATNDLIIGQSFETANSIPFANKTIVFSFWARAGANYSPTSSALNVRFYTGTGTDQAGYGSAFTGTATPISQTATLTTSWQRFQYTATLASNATQMQFLLFATPTGTAGAADSFDVTGFQVELGSVATPFSRSAGTLAGELAACQRYYVRYGGGANTPYTVGAATSTTGVDGVMTFPVQMRTAPTLSSSGDNRIYDFGSNFFTTTLSIYDAEKLSAGIRAAITGGTQYRPGRFQAYGDANAFIAFSAEL